MPVIRIYLQVLSLPVSYVVRFMKQNKGFTLAELIVIIAILIAIFGYVVFRFGDDLTLDPTEPVIKVNQCSQHSAEDTSCCFNK